MGKEVARQLDGIGYHGSRQLRRFQVMRLRHHRDRGDIVVRKQVGKQRRLAAPQAAVGNSAAGSGKILQKLRREARCNPVHLLDAERAVGTGGGCQRRHVRRLRRQAGEVADARAVAAERIETDFTFDLGAGEIAARIEQGGQFFFGAEDDVHAGIHLKIRCHQAAPTCRGALAVWPARIVSSSARIGAGIAAGRRLARST